MKDNFPEALFLAGFALVGAYVIGDLSGAHIIGIAFMLWGICIHFYRGYKKNCQSIPEFEEKRDTVQ